RQFAQRAAVFVREDFHEPAAISRPVGEDAPRVCAAGKARVVLHHFLQHGLIAAPQMPDLARQYRVLFRFGEHGFQLHHGLIATVLEAAVFVQHVGDPARHAGGEIAARHAQHDHGAAGHVFAAVVAHTFHHGVTAGVAHAETFACDAAKVRLAADRAIHDGVADNDVFARLTAELGRGHHGDAAARKTFADVVIAFADQFHRDAACEEGTEAL